MSYNLFHNLPELARKGGFALCDGSDEKNDEIDWRFIGEFSSFTRCDSFKIIQISASIDTSQIIRESDFEKLDQCIPFLIRSSIGNLLNVRILDPAIARIYVISQLGLQYLLFCTKFLDKSVYSLRENIFNYQKTTVKLEETIAQRDEEIAQLQKKLKRQDALNQQIFACTKCTKNFLSAALLDNHIQRKHPPVQESKDKDSNLINTIKLELEIKQLKEKLNVTEKELVDVAKKEPMECENCKRNAGKMFQSVAIQSNFEEKEKDDVEKDAISELLKNQMRNFEQWKHEEEARYREEIIELRTKLDDTIQMMKQNVSEKVKENPPSPAPRHLIVPEKLVESSKSDDTLWKSRYKELEKMYEDNQQRMALTVKSIEATYNEKMSKFEESVKNLTEEREKFHSNVKKNVEIEKKPEVPLTPRVIKTVYAQEISTESSSSESEDEVKVVPVARKSLEMDKIEEIPEPEPEKPKPKTIMESFSAQKFMIRPNKPKQQLTVIKESPQKPLENSREKAQKLFNQRLKSFGISHNQETMKKFEFENVHDQMVTKRDEVKGKHKSFFITRKNLKSKVDKIFSQKHKKNEKLKTKKDLEITVKSQIPERETKKSLKASTKPKFHEDLEQILAKKLSASTLKKPANQDENEQIPSTSAKNKKVLFDMKHLKDETVNEDDSDFDISSFSNFTADDDK